MDSRGKVFITDTTSYSSQVCSIIQTGKAELFDVRYSIQMMAKDEIKS